MESDRVSMRFCTSARRPLLCAALWIACVGCDGGHAPSKGDGGLSGVAGLPPPSPVWTLPSANSIFYAPRAVDLDGDDSLEVVIAGGNEMPKFGEVMALDAETGAVRRHASADAELYSSPVFLDVNGDGIKDVFVGRRDTTLIAVDGANGSVLWNFADANPVRESREDGHSRDRRRKLWLTENGVIGPSAGATTAPTFAPRQTPFPVLPSPTFSPTWPWRCVALRDPVWQLAPPRRKFSSEKVQRFRFRFW